ncbi:hypothetical protein [Pedobacter duraquae]|uniref:Uncharacterized protein n=1 Tax=Pedobacter duraquae TaxID=425511 RepID=A0A4R6IL17_9SPHI|nr:hypothetical protein [Pedobacter duraquae]TDO22763.1 hypothetical protein CLV32_1748 [Pedobacter duraquae]
MFKKIEFKIGRDAQTGEFMKVKDAQKNKKTAIVETISYTLPKKKK